MVAVRERSGGGELNEEGWEQEAEYGQEKGKFKKGGMESERWKE